MSPLLQLDGGRPQGNRSYPHRTYLQQSLIEERVGPARHRSYLPHGQQPADEVLWAGRHEPQGAGHDRALLGSFYAPNTPAVPHRVADRCTH